jgi:hypothetical protein
MRLHLYGGFSKCALIVSQTRAQSTELTEHLANQLGVSNAKSATELSTLNIGLFRCGTRSRGLIEIFSTYSVREFLNDGPLSFLT